MIKYNFKYFFTTSELLIIKQDKSYYCKAIIDSFPLASIGKAHLEAYLDLYVYEKEEDHIPLKFNKINFNKI